MLGAFDAEFANDVACSGNCVLYRSASIFINIPAIMGRKITGGMGEQVTVPPGDRCIRGTFINRKDLAFHLM